jgi:MFS family permease
MLKTIYGKAYTKSHAQNNIASITFAGTVLGSYLFGVLSDYWSRRNALLLGTMIIIVFTALGAGAYGAGGNTQGLFAAIAAYRFLIGIGIGGEYPAGSVGAAEASGELKCGHRNRWFILSTNIAIDSGFVVAALMPMILVLIFTDHHLRAAWRVALGLGVIPPLSVLYLRIKLKEPAQYNRQKMTKYPYWLILKYYWFRLATVSLIWFMYDFSAYSFSIYSSAWLAIILPKTAPLWKSFGW